MVATTDPITVPTAWQPARLFSAKLREALLDIGFTASIDDDSVYRLDHKLGQIILATHVDDGIGPLPLAGAEYSLRLTR